MNRVIIMAAKQVGDLSYFTSDLDHLINIIDSGLIKSSNKAELNPKTNKNQYSISFSRNMTAAARRNPRRWSVGIILNGDMLSNRYHLEPYSYASTAFNRGNVLVVKELKSYDNGTYTLSLVHWPTLEISKKLFDGIEDIILNLSDSDKQKMKLEISEGKQPRGGRKVLVRYNFNRPQGGPKLNSNNLSNALSSELFHHTAMNEEEERIWLNNLSLIDISGCIKGIIVPKNMYNEMLDPDSDDDRLDELQAVIEKAAGRNYVISTY